jgi:hypothetical protein
MWSRTPPPRFGRTVASPRCLGARAADYWLAGFPLEGPGLKNLHTNYCTKYCTLFQVAVTDTNTYPWLIILSHEWLDFGGQRWGCTDLEPTSSRIQQKWRPLLSRSQSKNNDVRIRFVLSTSRESISDSIQFWSQDLSVHQGGLSII